MTAHPKPFALSGQSPWQDDWGDLLGEEEALQALLHHSPSSSTVSTPVPPPPPAASGLTPPPPKPSRLASNSGKLTTLNGSVDTFVVSSSLTGDDTADGTSSSSNKVPSSAMLHPLRTAQSMYTSSTEGEGDLSTVPMVLDANDDDDAMS